MSILSLEILKRRVCSASCAYTRKLLDYYYFYWQLAPAELVTYATSDVTNPDVRMYQIRKYFNVFRWYLLLQAYIIWSANSFCFSLNLGGMRWRSWLTHCATSRKVAGSIPDDIIEIFRWHNPSGRTMALGSTQPLTKMSTTNISWG